MSAGARSRRVPMGAALLGMFLLSGCGGGPSESEYVEACMSKPDANEAACRCVAREGKARLSAKAWEAFVLDEQGKSDEASAISAKMSIQEQSAFVGAAIAIAQKCMSTAE